MHRKIVCIFNGSLNFPFLQGNVFLSMWGDIFVLIGYYLK